MIQQIESYIKDHELSWTSATLRSERARLKAVMSFLDGNPKRLWEALQTAKPYTRLTTWTRVCDFWSFINPGENPYVKFKEKNRRLFKNAYIPRKLHFDWTEAVERIKKIKNQEDRALAVRILGSGERYREAIQKETNVLGKGEKRRDVYRPDSGDLVFSRHYSSFTRSLKSVGLRAHDLRKLCATRLVEAGVNEADLLKVMGWSSMQTASIYLQPKKEEVLASIFSKLHEDLSK